MLAIAGRESPCAPASDGVISFEPSIPGRAERGDVFCDRLVPPYHCEPTDPDELVIDGSTSQECVGADLDVSADQHAIGEDCLGSDDAVVSDVGATHNEGSIANAGGVLDSGVCCAVNGGALANNHLVAYDGIGWICVIGLEAKMLRIETDESRRADSASVADLGWPVNVGCSEDDRPGADGDCAGDDRVRADFNVIGKNGAGIDDSGRMDFRHGENL